MKDDLTPAQERILNWLLEQYRQGNIKEQFWTMPVGGNGFLVDGVNVPPEIREDLGGMGFIVLVNLGYLIGDGGSYSLTSKCFISRKEIDQELRQMIFPRRKLRKLLFEHFSVSELNDLCFDLGIDSENLRAEAKGDFVVSLLGHAERNSRMDELIELCKKDKPQLDWSFEFNDQ